MPGTNTVKSEDSGLRRPHLLVVYGTLMKGQCNHHLLAQAEYVDEVFIRGYWLTDLVEYPGAIAGNESDGFYAELYAVSDAELAQCDVLEEINEANPMAGEYRREWIETSHGRAMIYVYNGAGSRPIAPITNWNNNQKR